MKTTSCWGFDEVVICRGVVFGGRGRRGCGGSLGEGAVRVVGPEGVGMGLQWG